MTTRRQFIETITLLLIPVGCSGSSDTGAGSGSNCTPSTSSNVQGHTHSICVPAADLTNPPAGGNTYPTSTDAGHSHDVTLTADELSAIQSGMIVMVETTNVGNHTHSFTISINPST